MSVEDPFGPIGPVIEYPDGEGPPPVIIIASGETSTEGTRLLAELCRCETPREVTSLDVVVASPWVINCKQLKQPFELMPTILRTTVVGNECRPTAPISTATVSVATGTSISPPPIEPPAEPGTFTAQIPLEMLITLVNDDFIGGLPLGTNYYSAAVYIDPDDYDGLVAAHFQACLHVDDVTFPAELVLEDENGTIYATLTQSSITAHNRIRGEFTLDPAAPHYYRFRVKPGVGGGDWDLQDCKILLDVVNSNRVKLQFLLTCGQQDEPGFGSVAGDDELNNKHNVANYGGSYAYSVFGLPTIPPGTLGDPGERPYEHNLFLKDESKFGTIGEWELEVIGKHFQDTPCGCAANCKAALFNQNTGLMVGGSELGSWQPGTVAASPERKVISFSNSATNFTNGDEFWIQHVLDPSGLPDGCRFEVTRAALYVTLTGTSIKAQIYHKLGVNWRNSATTKDFVEARYLHEPGKYTAGTTFYHECSGYITTAGTGTPTGFLKDLGVSDVLTVGTNVVSSDLAFTASYSRLRSGAISLTSGNRYYGRHTVGGTARLSHSQHLLIAEVPSA